MDLGLDVINGIFLDDEFVLLDDPIPVDHHFLYLGITLVHGHDLLLERRHLLDLLVDDGDLDGSFTDGLDYLVDVDDHGDFHGEFNEIGYLDDLFEETFNFVHSGHFIIDSDDSLDDGGHFPDGLLDLGDGLSDSGLHFLDGLVIVGNDLLDLLDHLTNDRLLDYIDYLLDTDLLTSDLHDLLHLLNNLDDPLHFSIDGNDLLDDSVDWEGDFDGDDCGPLDFDDFLHFNDLGDDAFDCDLLGHVHTYLHDLFCFLGDYLHNLNNLLEGDYLLYDLLHYSFDLIEDILDDFYLNDLVLDDRHLDYLLHLSDLLHFDDTINYLLDDLRHLHNLLNHSRHNHNLFHNLLNLNYLRDFHHLLDDLIDIDSDLFDTFNGAGYFNDLLNDDFDGIGLVDVVVDDLLHFDDLVDFDDLIDVLGHFDDLGDLHSFNHDLGDDLWHTDDLLLVEGHLHSAVNDLLHLPVDGDGLVDDLLDFLYPIAIDDLLLNDLDLLDSGHFHSHLDHLLNNPWDFHNPLYDLDDGDCLLDDDFNDLREFHHVVDYLAGIAVLDDFNWLLDDAIEGLDHLHDLLYDLLVDDWHLDHLADDTFHSDNLFPDDLDFPNLGDGMVDDPFHEDWLLHLNYLLNYDLHFDDLGDLNDPFHHLLDDARHFHDLFSVVGYFHYFLDDVIDVLDDLHWDMNDLLYFLDAHHLNDLLHNPLNGDHLRDLHYSLNDLLHYLLHLDDLGHHAEDLQNIVDTDNSQDFLVDHADHSLIDVQNSTVFQF